MKLAIFAGVAATASAQCTGTSASLPAAECATWQKFFDQTKGTGWTEFCADKRDDPCTCKSKIGNPCKGDPSAGMDKTERAMRDANIRGEKLTGWQEPDAGVCCKTNAAGENHITQLAFALNNLDGPLPDMSPLVELDNLSACGNNITGAFPAFPPSIKTLRMYTNHMSGEIPAAISALTNMKFMSLGDNDFTGPAPDLSALSSMTDVYLDCNHLSGAVTNATDWGSYTGKCFLDASTLLEKCSKPTDNTFSCPLPANAKKTCHATCK